MYLKLFNNNNRQVIINLYFSKSVVKIMNPVSRIRIAIKNFHVLSHLLGYARQKRRHKIFI